jgi:hypothetical protein
MIGSGGAVALSFADVSELARARLAALTAVEGVFTTRTGHWRGSEETFGLQAYACIQAPALRRRTDNKKLQNPPFFDFLRMQPIVNYAAQT